VEQQVKSAISANEATFLPQSYKTFVGALGAFFEHQCPHLGGSIMRDVLVKSIYQMVCQFYPETTHLKPGQTPWVTVAKSETASYGKSMKNTKLVPIVVSLIGENEIEERAKGKKLNEIKKDSYARVCLESDRQKGCVALAEIAIMFKTSVATVSKYIRQWELENNQVLPRRGTIHDMGPTLTHKKIIIHKLFIDKLTVQDTSRQTYHSFQAIYRYISSFKRVLICYRKEMTQDEISHALGMSKGLTKQYLEIIEEYKSKGHILEDIEKFDAKIAPHYDEYQPNSQLPSERK
jgi:hypothetical protein